MDSSPYLYRRAWRFHPSLVLRLLNLQEGVGEGKFIDLGFKSFQTGESLILNVQSFCTFMASTGGARGLGLSGGSQALSQPFHFISLY